MDRGRFQDIIAYKEETLANEKLAAGWSEFLWIVGRSGEAQAFRAAQRSATKVVVATEAS